MMLTFTLSSFITYGTIIYPEPRLSTCMLQEAGVLDDTHL
jgi:hypothetical protein